MRKWSWVIKLNLIFFFLLWQNPWKKWLKKRKIPFISLLGVQSIMAGKAQQQGFEAMGHAAATFRKQKAWMLVFGCLPLVIHSWPASSAIMLPIVSEPSSPTASLQPPSQACAEVCLHGDSRPCQIDSQCWHSWIFLRLTNIGSYFSFSSKTTKNFFYFSSMFTFVF